MRKVITSLHSNSFKSLVRRPVIPAYICRDHRNLLRSAPRLSASGQLSCAPAKPVAHSTPGQLTRDGIGRWRWRQSTSNSHSNLHHRRKRKFGIAFTHKVFDTDHSRVSRPRSSVEEAWVQTRPFSPRLEEAAARRGVGTLCGDAVVAACSRGCRKIPSAERTPGAAFPRRTGVAGARVVGPL